MASERVPKDNASMVMIGGGSHGGVQLDRATMTVYKRLHCTSEASESHLRREFHYLHNLSVALRPHPWLSCPEPLEVDPEQSTLRMTYCPGTPVDELLGRGDPGFDEHHEHVAEQVRTAVEVYVATFGEPYSSLSPANMIYDLEERVLYLYDFSKPRVFAGIDLHHYALEVSLGCFMARVMYQSVGPRTVWNRELRSRSEGILRSVVQPLIARHALDEAVIVQVARTVRHALIRRTPLDRRLHVWAARALWYRTVGNPLAERRAEALVTRPAGRHHAGVAA
jgi:hypothetical protein